MKKHTIKKICRLRMSGHTWKQVAEAAGCKVTTARDTYRKHRSDYLTSTASGWTAVPGTPGAMNKHGHVRNQRTGAMSHWIRTMNENFYVRLKCGSKQRNFSVPVLYRKLFGRDLELYDMVNCPPPGRPLTAQCRMVTSGEDQYAKLLHRPDVKRLYRSLLKDDPKTGCLNWTGPALQKEYGLLWVRDGNLLVRFNTSRLALYYRHGTSPCGAQARRSCNNPRCCEPAHLRWSFGSSTCKFTDKQVLAIRRRFDAGEPVTELAREFQVTTATITNIGRGLTYRHVSIPGVIL